MAKLRFNNENEAPWPDEDFANLPIPNREGTRVGCEFQEWDQAKRCMPTVSRTLFLGDLNNCLRVSGLALNLDSELEGFVTLSRMCA